MHNDLMKLIKMRHSGRSYDSSRPVTKEQISQIIEAARWAPSCFGDEPWRYIICDKKSQSWNKVHSCLNDGNKTWVANCPTLIIAIGSNKFRNPEVGDNRWGAYDTGSATYGMTLQATALGLMAHQMGGFNAEKVTQEFKIPIDFSPMAIIALGYEDKYAEPTPRTRRPVEELFFYDQWKA